MRAYIMIQGTRCDKSPCLTNCSSTAPEQLAPDIVPGYDVFMLAWNRVALLNTGLHVPTGFEPPAK